MARLIETKEGSEIGLYTKDVTTHQVTRVGEFSPNGGGLILGSAGVAGASGSASDNIKLHRAGSQILQLVIGSDTTPDGVLAPQSSLAKMNGVNYYNYVVGSLSQYNSGEATHSSLASIVSGGIPNGSKILIIGSTGDVSPVTVNSRVFMTGVGYDAVINCDVTLGSSSSKCLIKNLKFAGNFSLTSGSNNNIVTDCWISATGAVTDNNDNPNNLITMLQEV